MSQHNIVKIPKIDYIILPFIMALAFYLAFLPHLNYPYPVHVDEWVHLAYAKAMLNASSATFTDPFFGVKTIGLSSNLEAGFHLFWVVFHQISGISWLSIIRYSPAFIFIITILSVYILAQRQDFGWEAAFFTTLMLTTVGILGPGLFVPLAMGLLFITLSIFLVFNVKTGWSYLALLIFVSFLLSIHAPTAIAVGLILAPYILVNLRGNFKHGLLTTLALAIPFLVPFPWIFKRLAPTAKSLLTVQLFPDYVQLPLLIQTYGYLPTALCLFGTFVLALRGGRKSYGLILGLLTLLVMLATFYTFQYGVSIMYERGLTYMMLMMSIIAGAGLMAVKNFRLPAELGERLKVSLINQHTGKVLALGLIGIILVITIPARQNIPFYHMINPADYQAFAWIRENVDDSYRKALLDPWKATAFAAIAEKHVYTRTHAFPTNEDKEARDFLASGSKDTAFLKKNGISIVYSPLNVNNPDLRQVRKNIYLLQKDKLE